MLVEKPASQPGLLTPYPLVHRPVKDRFRQGVVGRQAKKKIRQQRIEK
jgi:hypothetical protein